MSRHFTLALFIVPLAAVCGAQTTAPATQPADVVGAAEARLPALRARVLELEGAFYREHPTAAAVERHVAALRETYSRDFNRGTAALRELPDPREAAGMYSTLRGEWNGVVAPEMCKDPIVGPVMKALVLSTPSARQAHMDRAVAADPTLRREALADPEVLWRTMVGQMEKGVPECRRRFEEAARRAGFPDWIVAEAKTDAEYQGKMEMLDTWLNVVTPVALKAARRELRHHEGLVWSAGQGRPGSPAGDLP